MNERYIQALGIVLTAAYFGAIVFLYWTAPRTLAEVSTKSQVAIGTYKIDQVKFDDGLRAFRAENYVVARDSFERADPERRDANTQFYIAYSYYRQGWGRISNDGQLFLRGIEAVDRVTTLNRDFKSEDPELKMPTPAELRNELEEGTKITGDDFNPLKLIRERK
ncbi:MAG: hypothetical protein ABI999_12070 [Acidobacteriota bacterium]